jgi:hypothetical protein
MGNGATFSLETLIFASILDACCGHARYSVYGDDLIVPRDNVARVIMALKYVGFIVNTDKSYTDGPFRESCGKDYYRGTDITPFYLRSTAAWDKPYAAHNVNGLAKLSAYGKLWEYLVAFTKANKLLITPYCDDTLAGVHVHPYFAYSQRLIRKSKRGMLEAKRYTRKGTSKVCFDSRSLALWHLTKVKATPQCEIERYLNKVRKVPRDPAVVNLTGEVTRYSCPAEKFVRGWNVWRMPDAGTSEDLFGFSEALLRES